TVRQPLTAAGRTHPSSVIPELRSSEAESATVTQLLAPSNDNALPKRPVAAQVAPLMVPLLPLPEASAPDSPVPPSSPRARTRTAGNRVRSSRTSRQGRAEGGRVMTTSPSRVGVDERREGECMPRIGPRQRERAAGAEITRGEFSCRENSPLVGSIPTWTRTR